MIQPSIHLLEYLIQTIPDLLLTAMDAEVFSFKPAPNKWSKKEIIGHLIDSAANNHHRFVRGQFEHHPEVHYNPDKWNECGFYQDIDGRQVIAFWTLYNKQLLEIIKRIPETHLTRTVKVENDLHTLEFLIMDYVKHMEHHLRQVIAY